MQIEGMCNTLNAEKFAADKYSLCLQLDDNLEIFTDEILNFIQLMSIQLMSTPNFTQAVWLNISTILCAAHVSRYIFSTTLCATAYKISKLGLEV